MDREWAGFYTVQFLHASWVQWVKGHPRAWEREGSEQTTSKYLREIGFGKTVRPRDEHPYAISSCGEWLTAPMKRGYEVSLQQARVLFEEHMKLQGVTSLFDEDGPDQEELF